MFIFIDPLIFTFYIEERRETGLVWTEKERILWRGNENNVKLWPILDRSPLPRTQKSPRGNWR
jgi:hypothetical protein